jgi:hypothetical protein
MNIGLILYTLFMTGVTLFVIKVTRKESVNLARILNDRGETESVAKSKGSENTTVDFRDMGRSSVYTYMVDGKSYTYETKLTLPFTFGKEKVKILYEKSHPENSVADSWVEMYGVSAFVTVWTIAIIITTVAAWIYIAVKG